MKRMLILGMAVLVLSLAFTACGGGDDSGDTYKGTAFKVSDSNFTTAGFSSLTSEEFRIETISDLSTAISKVSALSDEAIEDPDGGDGISLSDINAFLQEKVTEGLINSDQKNQIVNALKSKGYVLAVKNIGNSEVGIVAAMKE